MRRPESWRSQKTSPATRKILSEEHYHQNYSAKDGKNLEDVAYPTSRGYTTILSVLMKFAPLFGFLAVAASAQSPHVKQTEWPTYGADLASTRYRPLDQINASNFNKLEVAWRFKTDSLGNRPEYKLEGTPLMVSGVVYATGGTRRAVFALDAATGELLWMHSEHEGARGAAAPRQLSGRGLAYWSDGKEERILYTTPGYRLIALDAKTGALVRLSAQAAWWI